MKRTLQSTVFVHLSPQQTAAALEAEAARIRSRGNQAAISFVCLADGRTRGDLSLQFGSGKTAVTWNGSVFLETAWSPHYTVMTVDAELSGGPALWLFSSRSSLHRLVRDLAIQLEKLAAERGLAA